MNICRALKFKYNNIVAVESLDAAPIAPKPKIKSAGAAKDRRQASFAADFIMNRRGQGFNTLTYTVLAKKKYIMIWILNEEEYRWQNQNAVSAGGLRRF